MRYKYRSSNYSSLIESQMLKEGITDKVSQCLKSFFGSDSENKATETVVNNYNKYKSKYSDESIKRRLEEIGIESSYVDEVKSNVSGMSFKEAFEYFKTEVSKALNGKITASSVFISIVGTKSGKLLIKTIFTSVLAFLIFQCTIGGIAGSLICNGIVVPIIEEYFKRKSIEIGAAGSYFVKFNITEFLIYVIGGIFLLFKLNAPALVTGIGAIILIFSRLVVVLLHASLTINQLRDYNKKEVIGKGRTIISAIGHMLNNIYAILIKNVALTHVTSLIGLIGYGILGALPTLFIAGGVFMTAKMMNNSNKKDRNTSISESAYKRYKYVSRSNCISF